MKKYNISLKDYNDLKDIIKDKNLIINDMEVSKRGFDTYGDKYNQSDYLSHKIYMEDMQICVLQHYLKFAIVF